MYWLFETDILHRRNRVIQARLVTPPANRLTETDCGYGFRGPKQMQPYGVDLKLTYRVDPRHPHPDNYFEGFGFSLYSERLAGLMRSYGVKSEAFPVTLVDKQGTPLPGLRYAVFHLMEGIFDAMDEQALGVDRRPSRWHTQACAGLREVRTQTYLRSRSYLHTAHAGRSQAGNPTARDDGVRIPGARAISFRSLRISPRFR